MNLILTGPALLSLAVWLYRLLLRGGFWRGRGGAWKGRTLATILEDTRLDG
jgi:hypothetical protein